MRHFGIIGFPLLHSFSAKYFSEKFEREHIEAEYSLYRHSSGWVRLTGISMQGVP